MSPESNNNSNEANNTPKEPLRLRIEQLAVVARECAPAIQATVFCSRWERCTKREKKDQRAWHQRVQFSRGGRGPNGSQHRFSPARPKITTASCIGYAGAPSTPT